MMLITGSGNNHNLNSEHKNLGGTKTSQLAVRTYYSKLHKSVQSK